MLRCKSKLLIPQSYWHMTGLVNIFRSQSAKSVIGLTDIGLRFSPSKTVAVCFSKSQRREEVLTLKLMGDITPYEDQVKFFGLIFDKKLTWGPNIDYPILKKSLSNLKMISSYDWRADRSLLKSLRFMAARFIHLLSILSLTNLTPSTILNTVYELDFRKLPWVRVCMSRLMNYL